MRCRDGESSSHPCGLMLMGLWEAPVFSRGEVHPYTNLPCAVPTADYDEATATLYEVDDNGNWDELDSETIKLHSTDEVESETVWKQCEQLLAERNGVSEYDVETPW